MRPPLGIDLLAQPRQLLPESLDVRRVLECERQPGCLSDRGADRVELRRRERARETIHNRLPEDPVEVVERFGPALQQLAGAGRPGFPESTATSGFLGLLGAIGVVVKAIGLTGRRRDGTLFPPARDC